MEFCGKRANSNQGGPAFSEPPFVLPMHRFACGGQRAQIYPDGNSISRGPLFALVARLVHQKGVDLVLESAQTIVESGGQIVVTGKGEAQFEEALCKFRNVFRVRSP